MLNDGIIARTKREACGLTQSEFGRIIGMSSTQISKYEKGLDVGTIYENAIKDGLTKIYHELDEGARYRAHLKSLALRLDYASATEARDIGLKIITASTKMEWYLSHR